jgi:eukaryotic-like serine/threonine-protein kinase
MGDLVGQSLAHFRIVEKLGEGGMGVVYRATDEKLRRSVALKVLPDSFAQDEDRRRRFLREARSAAAVTHANIATVHEVGEADGHVFIAMELVEGETLRARLENGLSVAESVRIAKEIARGLARAHEKGIVHRDLKPENVMLTRHDEVKILDFGLAKAREERVPTASALENADTETNLTREGKLLGTPGYMSPEQARGQEVDARTDVFAFGVVLYEMLTGERPFVGGTTQDVLTAVMRDAPKRASEKNPLVPPEIDRVVERCLEKLRDARYANGQELVDALGAALPEARVSEPSARKPSAPTVSLLTPEATARPSAKAARARLPLLFASVAVLLGIGGIAAWRSRIAPATSPSAAPSAPKHVTSGIAITDHPPPKTASAEALAAYTAGLRHVRDAEGSYAGDDFNRAATLDPSMAAADLRAVLNGVSSINSDVGRMREFYAAAVEHRAALDARDLLLLQLAEVFVADPELPKGEGPRRARAVVERFPEDAEAEWLLGVALFLADELPASRVAFNHALELDPQFAAALGFLAVSYAYGRDAEPDRALEFVRRCLEITPSAGSCLRARVLVNVDRGRCDEMEDDARRLAVVEPKGHRTYELLAQAMAARTAPVERIRDVLAKRTALEPDDRSRRRAEIQATLWTATLVGDLEAAEKAALAWDDLYADSVVADDHDPPITYLLDVLDETGEVSKALEVADAYDRRSSGWTGKSPSIRAGLAYLRRRAKRIDEAAFQRTRDDASAASTRRRARTGLGQRCTPRARGLPQKAARPLRRGPTRAHLRDPRRIPT